MRVKLLDAILSCFVDMKNGLKKVCEDRPTNYDSPHSTPTDSDTTHKHTCKNALSRRLCPSCSSLRFSDIEVGKIYYFSAISLPNQLGCNLCQLMRRLYIDLSGFSSEPQIIQSRTSLPQAICVEILKAVHGVYRRHSSNVVVFEVRITNTWYDNYRKMSLFFRDLQYIHPKPYEQPASPARTDEDGHPHGEFPKWANLVQARLWHDNCLRNHPDCQSIVPETTETGLHGSTRFIDVQQRRLVHLDEIFPTMLVEFVALSYVWGNDYQLRTVSSNLSTFRTRLPGDGEESDYRLPSTIEDAILVTRTLGYRFLWVDALCIIQDSPDDLTLQLMQMDKIYGLATLTIAARGSYSSDTGLFGISVPRIHFTDSDAEVIVNEATSIGFWDLGHSIDEEYEEKHGKLADPCYYMWRGWTFQEQILSTRVLEFNAGRMVFWCGKNKSCAERGYPQYAQSDMHNPYHFRHAVRRFQRREKLFPNDTSSNDVADEDWLLARWNTMRQAYSTRSLSFHADRKRAILGTARALNRLMGGGISHDGIVSSDLQSDMVWFTDIETERRHKSTHLRIDRAAEGLYPTWSWLNIWPLMWPAMSQPLPEVSLRILDDMEGIGGSGLEIEAAMLTLRLVEDSDGVKKLAYPDGSFAKIKLHFDSVQQPELEIICVPMVCAITSMAWERELLLLRREGQYHYRVGVGSLREEEYDKFDSFLGFGKERIKRIICL